ncbi:uncharacterized protein B0H64DRAFT_388404 [Chaetomium fimeti]|uniref:Uncharacterized protein n=1 Tax=Chaetomium fimeti TaxID=1854472 RepID=A0AAE0HMY9_9PEZI|nr:hypothetical protein B0H64DRAFT_388404 [Chaetomium fimeti]
MRDDKKKALLSYLVTLPPALGCHRGSTHPGFTNGTSRLSIYPPGTPGRGAYRLCAVLSVGNKEAGEGGGIHSRQRKRYVDIGSAAKTRIGKLVMRDGRKHYARGEEQTLLCAPIASHPPRAFPSRARLSDRSGNSAWRRGAWRRYRRGTSDTWPRRTSMVGGGRRKKFDIPRELGKWRTSESYSAAETQPTCG